MKKILVLVLVIMLVIPVASNAQTTDQQISDLRAQLLAYLLNLVEQLQAQLAELQAQNKTLNQQITKTDSENTATSQKETQTTQQTSQTTTQSNEQQLGSTQEAKVAVVGELVSISVVSPHTPKEAIVKFKVSFDTGTPEIIIHPDITALTTGDSVRNGRGFKYLNKGGESDYSYIDYTKNQSVTLTKANSPHIFEFYHSYNDPILSFDYTINAEMASFEGDGLPVLVGFPIKGTYDVCDNHSNIHQIRVMCGTE